MTHDRITIDPRIMFGKPVIKGTRVPVDLILRKLGAGMGEDEIIEQHPHLTRDDLRAARAFAADGQSTARSPSSRGGPRPEHP